VGAITATLLAAGVATGIGLERAIIGRTFRPDADRDEPLGSLHSEPVEVIADDGVRLHAEIDEPTDPSAGDVTIVFSHGYALSMDSWHFERRDLRTIARLVFWDQRSHGRSGRGAPESHNIDQLGRDLARVVEECAPSGPVILVGHSMGGMTMMAFAAHFPELFGDRIVGAALIATSSGRMKENPLGLPMIAAALLHKRLDTVAGLMRTRSALIEKRRARASDLTFLLMKAYSFGGQSSPSQTQFVTDMLNATPIDVVAEYLPEFDRHDKVAALVAFQRVETVVMVGDADRMTPLTHSDEIMRHIPGAEYMVLLATGHTIITEKYPEVNQQLRELVAKVRSSLAVAS